jgi:hypothetical protein
VVAVPFGVVLKGGAVHPVAVKFAVGASNRPVGLVPYSGVANHKSLPFGKAQHELSTTLVVSAVVAAERPFWKLDAGRGFSTNRQEHREADACGQNGADEAGFWGSGAHDYLSFWVVR